MSVPTLRANAGIYTLVWDDEQVLIRVDRIKEDSRYTITGELTVKTTEASAPGHLHQARLNLTSTSARRTVSKYLTDRSNHIDWDALIEQTCVKVLESHRQGEPVLAISEIEIPDKIPYRVEPFMFDGELNLIYGDGGIGKSYLAAYLACLVQEGYPATGLMPDPGAVLYLDYETSSITAARRITTIYRGLGLEPSSSSIQYRFCFQPIAADIQEIQRVVAEKDIQLIIIDSAGPACGGEPEQASATIQYFTALRSLRVTSLTIAHKSKGSTVGPFGSVYWMNYPRTVYELKKSQEVEQDTLYLGCFHRKVNDGKLRKPLGLQFHFSDGTVTVTKAEVRDVPELADELSIPDRMAGLLQGGSLTAEEISENLEVKISTVRVNLTRYQHKRFIKLPSGQWGNLVE